MNKEKVINQKIDILSFCESYNKKIESMRNADIKSIIKRRYAPYLEKTTICKIMAEKSLAKNEKGIYYIDPCVNKLNFVAAIIALYTNLEYSTNKDGKIENYACYDALRESGVLDEIIKDIGDDIEELLLVNKDCLDSLYNEYCSTEAFIGRQVEKISLIFSSMTESVISKIAEEAKNEDIISMLVEKLKTE